MQELYDTIIHYAAVTKMDARKLTVNFINSLLRNTEFGTDDLESSGIAINGTVFAVVRLSSGSADNVVIFATSAHSLLQCSCDNDSLCGIVVGRKNVIMTDKYRCEVGEFGLVGPTLRPQNCAPANVSDVINVISVINTINTTGDHNNTITTFMRDHSSFAIMRPLEADTVNLIGKNYNVTIPAHAFGADFDCDYRNIHIDASWEVALVIKGLVIRHHRTCEHIHALSQADIITLHHILNALGLRKK